MSRRMEIWCDGCGNKIPRVEVQWSGCADNDWMLYDFCGYACANKIRDSVLALKAAKKQVQP